MTSMDHWRLLNGHYSSLEEAERVARYWQGMGYDATAVDRRHLAKNRKRP